MDPSKKATVFQYAAAFAAGMSAMSAGAWLAWPSSVLGPLESGKEGIKLESDQLSTLVSLMDFGNIISPIPSSYLMDAIGRKTTLLASAAVYLASCLFALFGNQVWMLYVARFLAGMGKGMSFAVCPIFIGEIGSNKIRGALSTVFIGLLHIGLVFEYAIGPLVSYYYLNLINLFIPIVFFLAFFFLPESPYYLLMKGRNEAARENLRKYRCVKKVKSGPGSPLDDEFKQITINVEADMANKGRFIDLLATKGSRKALLIISLLALFQRASGISPTLAYTTSFIPKNGGGASPDLYMFIFGVINLTANFLATPLVDTLGRKPLLLISSMVTAITMGVSGVFYYMLRNTSVDMTHVEWIPYACLMIFATSYSLGIGFVPSTLVGELFPTNIKSYAGCVSAIMLALTSFVVNKIFQSVSELWGLHVMFAIFTIAMILCFLYVLFFVFETKGKSFSDIQAILHAKD